MRTLRCPTVVVLSLIGASLAAQLPDARVVIDGPSASRADTAVVTAEAGGFSGVVLVGHHGRIVLSKGYGMANRATQTRMTPNAVVAISSAAKAFTAIAILQLADHGRLKLDDKLPRFFSNVPSDKAAITIRHLLTHRSGLESYIGGEDEPMTKEQAVRRALNLFLHFKPGSEEAYSNAGYVLLAAIVERASGKPFEEYLRAHVFEPLGMHQTGLTLPNFSKANVAHEYNRDFDRKSVLERVPIAGGHGWTLRGAGVMVSTAQDMWRFYHGIATNALSLEPESRKLLWLSPGNSGMEVGSDGLTKFMYSRSPERDLDIIVQSSSNAYPAERVMSGITAAFGR
jgi:CubicO group peptidase (beta-lactamase class C family)